MNLLVMMDKTGCIGINGDQIVHLKKDLDRFKAFTTGKIIIYGRKTMATFPNGLPLKNRKNVVLSNTLSNSNLTDLNNDTTIIMSNIFDIIKNIPEWNSSDMYVIGGESVYRQLLPWVNRIYVTKVNIDFDLYMNQQGNMVTSKAFFPIDILENDFKVINNYKINDVDRTTNTKYVTHFIEYVRL